MFVNWFVQSAQKFPHRPAVEVNHERLSYKELGLLASRIADAIQKQNISGRPVGLLAYRSFTAYAGVLGIMYAKNIYLPLNPNFPRDRTRKMINMVGCRAMIVGSECRDYFLELLPDLPSPMTVFFWDDTQIQARPQDGNHNFVFLKEVEAPGEFDRIKDIDEAAIAYFVFTSGSTGEPKIVPQSNKNVVTYLDYVAKRYRLDENDRVSQTFELTFDNSIHDMFICWKHGACLYCVPRNHLMMPSGFIKDKQLTVWYSVPSIGLNMIKLNRLPENAFPSLRYTLFEALPKSLAVSWARAAKNSLIENYYGITETTHQVSVYMWDPETSEAACVNDIVPIGKIFAGLKYCILDEHRQNVNPGEPGELYVSGVQITNGYYNDPERTKAAYVKIPHLGNDVWFKTGDLVKERADGNLNYLGRLDNQVKILGNRVELQEVDCILKRASNSELVVSLAWPIENGAARGIVAFVAESKERQKSKILDCCRHTLPPYMVPQDIFFIDRIPLNDNGKFDKKKLIAMLEEKK